MTRRERYLQKKYGISEDEYELLFAAHGGRCWICGRTTKRRLHVEHDHKTGAIRGLACWPCNKGLQTFADDSVRLRAAARYLESDEADLILGKGSYATNITTPGE